MATAPYGVRLLVGAAVTAFEETRRLPQTILTYPMTIASQVAHLVMKVQQDVADLVNRGDETLEGLRAVAAPVGVGGELGQGLARRAGQAKGLDADARRRASARRVEHMGGEPACHLDPPRSVSRRFLPPFLTPLACGRWAEPVSLLLVADLLSRVSLAGCDRRRKTTPSGSSFKKNMQIQPHSSALL
jgi:hypothetical protein